MLRVRLVSSELRSLCFSYWAGWAHCRAICPDTPSFGATAGHAGCVERFSARTVFYETDHLLLGILGNFLGRVRRFSRLLRRNKICDTSQNLGRSAKPLIYSRHPLWHAPKFPADRCDSCFGFDFDDEPFIAFCSRNVGEPWCVHQSRHSWVAGVVVDHCVEVP